MIPIHKPAQKPRTFRLQAEKAVSGFPALMIATQKAAENVLHGERAQRKAGPGEKFWQFREYTETDRPQDIDWRRSARTERVYIRQKERQTPQTVLLWCGGGAGMEFRSSGALQAKAEAAKILTLGLAILITRAGEQAGLLGGERPGRSEAALERIGQALCAPGELPEDLPDFYTPAGPQKSALIQTGDFLDPPEEIEKTFRGISERTQGGFVIQVLDPAEIELPYNGRALFETPGGAHRTLIDNVVSIRSAYRERMNAHIEALRNLSTQCGWKYFLHRTDQPVEDILGRIWMQMDRERRP